MNWLRRTPLWMSLGLLWWAVLFAYASSRPLLLYRVSIYGGASDLDGLSLAGGFALGALSFAHALGAAWIVTRVLPHFRAGRNAGSFAWWTLLVAWLAVASGSFLSATISSTTLAVVSAHPFAVLVGLAGNAYASIVMFPLFAFTLLWSATWVILPLAAATVFIVRRWAPRPVPVDWLGRPLQPAG